MYMQTSLYSFSDCNLITHTIVPMDVIIDYYNVADSQCTLITLNIHLSNFIGLCCNEYTQAKVHS